MLSELVAINGEIMNPQDAKISVFDRGFLYVDSVYEVARRYNGVFFALEDHIDRMFYSASRIDLNLQMDERDYLAEIYRVAHESSLQDAYMRIIVTRGEAGINLDPYSSDNINRIIYMRSLDGYVKAENYERGIDIMTAQIQRNAKKAMDPNIKSGNYLNNIIALGEAKRAKAQDAILVNRDGFVTEGTTWNIFMISKGVVYSPPDQADILQGITRRKIKSICEKNQIKYVERFFTPDELHGCDEAFATGSVKEVVPVRSVDGKVLNNGKPGEQTQKIHKLYKDLVSEYCAAWRARFP